MAITPIAIPYRYVNSNIVDYTDTGVTTYTTELRNDTVYFYSTLSSLTLTANASMQFSGFDFKSGSTATSCSYPSAWIWEGDECSDGDFAPDVSSYYRVAIEYSRSFETYICTVQKLHNKSS